MTVGYSSVVYRKTIVKEASDRPFPRTATKARMCHKSTWKRKVLFLKKMMATNAGKSVNVLVIPIERSAVGYKKWAHFYHYFFPPISYIS